MREILMIAAVGAFALAIFAYFSGAGRDAVSIAASAVGVSFSDDKLGWLDDAELSTGDRARIAAITGHTYDSNLSVIRSIQGGARGNLTRKDFELLRQDRRRAQAAYPDVDHEKLFASAWFNIDMSARVPSEFCTSHNSNGTMGADGKWYLDGGCYLSYVRGEFPNRADASTTKKFYVELKQRHRAEKIERLTTDGPFAMWSGTGGSMSVRLDKETGNVVIQRAQEWSNKANRWTMPFVVDEWADIYAGDLEAIKKLPSFAQAKEEEIDIAPSGTSVSVGSFGSTGGVLLPGESMTVTSPVRIR